MEGVLHQTNENTTTEEGYVSALPMWVFKQFIPTFSVIICVIGLFGSGLVIFIKLRFPNMKSTTNTYILNLASADFLFFVDVPFLIYFNRSNNWIFGDAMCKLVMGIDGMNMFTGIFTLTAMAIDRYKAVIKKTPSKKQQNSKASVICLTLWIISAVVTVPLWMYAVVEYDTSLNTTLCSILCPVNVGYVFVLYAFTLGFLLPLGIITACYIGTMVSLIKRRERTRKCGNKIRIGRVAILVLVAVVIFIICWLPFWIVRLWLLFRAPTEAVEILYYCSLLLIYVNSCLNPLIYACFKQDFRKNLSKMCCCLNYVS
ncbi:somatostatin receptor type 2-like [Glandiceps talaboti]